MINIGFNLASLLGFVDVIYSLFVLGISIYILANQGNILTFPEAKIYISQSSISFLFLLLIGFVLIFNGWRLDLVLLFSWLLMNILIIVKDIYIWHLIFSYWNRP